MSPAAHQESVVPTGLTRGLAGHAGSPVTLTAAATAAATEAVIATLASAWAGADHPVVEAMAAVHQDRPGTAVLAGRSEALSPCSAAGVLGAAASTAATGLYGGGESPWATVAAALAVGASGRPPTGIRLLGAVALGWEVQIRLARTLASEPGPGGWDLDAVCGTIGACVAAAAVSGADPARAVNALGIAASSTVGVGRVGDGALRALLGGKAAENGVLAVLLAAEGVTGSPEALEAERGYLGVLTPGLDRVAATRRILDGLGRSWHLPPGPRVNASVLPEPLLATCRHLADDDGPRAVLEALRWSAGHGEGAR